MLNYNRLKKIAKAKKITIKRLAEEYGEMTETGFHAAIRNNTLSVKVLESIAEAVDMPVSWLLENGENNLDGIILEAPKDPTGERVKALKKKYELTDYQALVIAVLEDIGKTIGTKGNSSVVGVLKNISDTLDDINNK